MKHGRSVYTGSTLLALGVLVGSAIAGTLGKCQPAVSVDVCQQVGICGHEGSDPGSVPCFVRISETGGAATVTADNVAGGTGNSAEYICVNYDTEILWFTLEEKSSFKLKFGVPHPFVSKPVATAPTFKGKKGKPSSELAEGSPDACYQYSVKHCIGRKCTPFLDPKVIVKGAGLLPPGAKGVSEHSPNK
jgi:hypothetical protein